MSECDIPELYVASEQVARKEYFCCECAAKIIDGERYLLAKGKWNGEFKQYRQHIVCSRACEFIRDWQDGECIGFGELFYWINNEAWGMNHWDRKNPLHRIFRGMVAKIKWRMRRGDGLVKAE